MLSDEDDRILRAAVAAWSAVPDPLWPRLSALFTAVELAAGEALVTPGSGRHRFGLVVSGLLRVHYPEADGSEANKTFVAEGGFVGSISAVITGVDPHYGIAALGPARVLAADPARWRELIPTDIHFERLARQHAEWLLLIKEEREHDFLSVDAAGRYRRLLAREPELAARVPARHLASYLGITAVQLSRIKSRLRKGGAG